MSFDSDTDFAAEQGFKAGEKKGLQAGLGLACSSFEALADRLEREPSIVSSQHKPDAVHAIRELCSLLRRTHGVPK